MPSQDAGEEPLNQKQQTLFQIREPNLLTLHALNNVPELSFLSFTPLRNYSTK